MPVRRWEKSSRPGEGDMSKQTSVQHKGNFDESKNHHKTRPPRWELDIAKLIIAMTTLGPLGYGMGFGGAWILRADTPCLFGIGMGGLLTLMAMWPSAGTPETSIVGTSENEIVPFSNDPTALDMSFDGTGPFLVKRRRP